MYVLACMYWYVCVGMYVLVCMYWYVCIGMYVLFECHPMPVTARHGFPCSEKTGGAQANQVFLVASLLNSKEILDSVDSNCVLDSGFATFWIFPFGSHVEFYV